MEWSKQYQMLINDVTELQLAEQALKASEQNFHNSLDNSFEGINIADDQGHVYYVNKAFLDIFGYKILKKSEPVLRMNINTRKNAHVINEDWKLCSGVNGIPMKSR